MTTPDDGRRSVPVTTPDDGRRSVPVTTPDDGRRSVPVTTPDDGRRSVPVTTTLASVLGAVARRVSYLRALACVPDEAGWTGCDTLGAVELSGAVEAGMAARHCPDRGVAASLLAQSYAFRVASVSLAAYAVGLAWPPPGASDQAVRFAGGRAGGLSFRTAGLGDPDDLACLVGVLIEGHLAPFASVVRGVARVGERLVLGNVAASCAAVFRAVEGAARDRGDAAERAGVRLRAEAFFAAARWLSGTGRFERVEAGGRSGWYWTRTSCCLWYRLAGSSTCDDCSLIPVDDLCRRRSAEVEAGGA